MANPDKLFMNNDHNNYVYRNTAEVAPAVTDDYNSSYVVGSKWFNSATETMYECLDPTVGAAVWVVTSASADSTTEKSTGVKWIDDSVIYEKVIALAAADMPNNNSKTKAHSITDLDTVVDLTVVVTNGTTHYKGESGVLASGATLAASVNATNIVLQSTANWSTMTGGHVIIKYTKS